jgi:hypothetical protein
MNEHNLSKSAATMHIPDSWPYAALFAFLGLVSIYILGLSLHPGVKAPTLGSHAMKNFQNVIAQGYNTV